MTMTRWLWVLASLSLASCSHNRIEKFDRPWYPWGLQAGANFAKAEVDGVDQEGTVGLMAGENVEVELNDYLALRTEAWFVTKGTLVPANSTLFGQTVTGSTSYLMSYIELDVLLKAKLDYAGFKPFVMGGPFIARNILNRTEGSGSPPDARRREFEAGVTAGAGFEIDLSESTALILAGRYALGLTSAVENSPAWKSKGFHAVIGFQVNLRPDRGRLKRARHYSESVEENLIRNEPPKREEAASEESDVRLEPDGDAEPSSTEEDMGLEKGDL